MGIVIKATGVSEAGGDSSIDNAVQAAQRCLESAGVQGTDIDLLINVGVYRDDNIMEPSIAALIQQKLGLNPDPVRDNIHARTFSFDLMNGACGFLNAVEVAGAMLQAGVYRNVLVVGGDVHPSRRPLQGFPFSSLGGAALLGYVANEKSGFSSVKVHSHTENGQLGFRVQGAVADFGDSGRALGVFTGEPEYPLHFCQTLGNSARRFLMEYNITPDQVDVLVTSQIEAGFPAMLAQTLELPSTAKVMDLHDEIGDPHTSVPMICLDRLKKAGMLQPGTRILFALVGSGIATTCALYRVPV